MFSCRRGGGAFAATLSASFLASAVPLAPKMSKCEMRRETSADTLRRRRENSMRVKTEDVPPIRNAKSEIQRLYCPAEGSSIAGVAKVTDKGHPIDGESHQQFAEPSLCREIHIPADAAAVIRCEKVPVLD